MVRGKRQDNQTVSLIQSNPHLVSIAAGRFGIERPEAELNSREVTELNAVYFWTPVRGGGALLVGEDESVLFAHSSVPYDVHIAAFKDGRRTDRRINPVFGVLAGAMQGQSDRRAQ